MRLKDKVAIITGAGSGLGKESALLFAKEGAGVVVADYDFKKAIEVVNLIQDNGGRALAAPVDVSVRKTVEEMVRRTIEHFQKIDILINNAGITADATLIKMSEEQFDKVIEVNLKGVFNCTQVVVPHMIEKNYGRIINTSSIVGLTSNFGQTNYGASKAAVINMTKTWSRELSKYNITSNAVAPGFILTEMVQKMPEKVIKMMEEKVPLKRLGSPKDIANTYLWLAGEEANYVNGSVIEVNGGLTL